MPIPAKRTTGSNTRIKIQINLKMELVSASRCRKRVGTKQKLDSFFKHVVVERVARKARENGCCGNIDKNVYATDIKNSEKT